MDFSNDTKDDNNNIYFNYHNINNNLNSLNIPNTNNNNFSLFASDNYINNNSFNIFENLRKYTIGKNDEINYPNIDIGDIMFLLRYL